MSGPEISVQGAPYKISQATYLNTQSLKTKTPSLKISRDRKPTHILTDIVVQERAQLVDSKQNRLIDLFEIDLIKEKIQSIS